MSGLLAEEFELGLVFQIHLPDYSRFSSKAKDSRSTRGPISDLIPCSFVCSGTGEIVSSLIFS